MNEVLWLLIFFVIMATLISLLLWVTRKSRNNAPNSKPSVAVSPKEITDKESFLDFLKVTQPFGTQRQRERITVKNINLENSDLCQADLKYFRFESINFQNSNLCKANLIGVELRNVNLRGANLSGADLSSSRISGETDLTGANLQDASLRHASVWSGKLQNVNLQNADLQSTIFHTGQKDFSQCNLKDAKYNFFTQWDFFDPEQAGSVSIDGLGPNPMYAARDQWFYYKLVRKGTLVQIRIQHQRESGAKLHTRDKVVPNVKTKKG